MIARLNPQQKKEVVLAALGKAELLSGRTLTDETKNAICEMLISDFNNHFSWVTLPYLNKAIEHGLAGEFKYLDYKTICKWIRDFKQSPEMRLKIVLESPLIPTDVPEWENTNWQMETNKALTRYRAGSLSYNVVHTGIYARLMLDGHLPLHAYRKFYVGEDLNEIYTAQRKTVIDFFQRHPYDLVYNPNQFFKS